MHGGQEALHGGNLGQGSFLPAGDPRRGSLVAVLGPRVKRELFGDENALGRFVRIAGHRLRVIGVMAPKGRMLGFDIDDTAYVTVASAEAQGALQIVPFTLYLRYVLSLY